MHAYVHILNTRTYTYITYMYVKPTWNYKGKKRWCRGKEWKNETSTFSGKQKTKARFNRNEAKCSTQTPLAITGCQVWVFWSRKKKIQNGVFGTRHWFFSDNHPSLILEESSGNKGIPPHTNPSALYEVLGGYYWQAKQQRTPIPAIPLLAKDGNSWFISTARRGCLPKLTDTRQCLRTGFVFFSLFFFNQNCDPQFPPVRFPAHTWAEQQAYLPGHPAQWFSKEEAWADFPVASET